MWRRAGSRRPGLPKTRPGRLDLLIRGIRQFRIYPRPRRACLHMAFTFAANAASLMTGVPRTATSTIDRWLLETMSSARPQRPGRRSGCPRGRGSRELSGARQPRCPRRCAQLQSRRRLDKGRSAAGPSEQLGQDLIDAGDVGRASRDANSAASTRGVYKSVYKPHVRGPSLSGKGL